MTPQHPRARAGGRRWKPSLGGRELRAHKPSTHAGRQLQHQIERTKKGHGDWGGGSVQDLPYKYENLGSIPDTYWPTNLTKLVIIMLNDKPASKHKVEGTWQWPEASICTCYTPLTRKIIWNVVLKKIKGHSLWKNHPFNLKKKTHKQLTFIQK